MNPEVPGSDPPLEWLRDAWRAQRPPAPDAGDPVEAAVVDWLRRAHRVPPPPMPRPLAGRRGRLFRLASPLPAAAAVLAALLFGTRLLEHSPAPGDAEVPAASSVRSPARTVVAVSTGPAGIERAEKVPLPGPAMPVVARLLASGNCSCVPTGLPVLIGARPSARGRLALVQRLLRAGEYSRAAELARALLETGETEDERLGALCQLALSFQALGRIDESVAYRDQLERAIATPGPR